MGSLTNAGSVAGGAKAASSGATKNSSGSPDDRNTKSTPAPVKTSSSSSGKVSSAGSVAAGARSVSQGDTGTKNSNSAPGSSSSSSGGSSSQNTGTRDSNGSAGIDTAARERSTLNGRANSTGDATTYSQLDDWLNDTTVPSRSLSQIRTDLAHAKGYDPYDAEAQTPGSNSWSNFQDMVGSLSPSWDAAHGAGTAAIPKGMTADQWAQMQHVPLQQLDEWQAAQGHGRNVNLSTSMMPEDPQGFVDFQRALGNVGTLNWKGRPESTNIEDRTRAPAVAPSNGGLDLAAIAHSLNGPYLKRVEQNQGVAPFEGPVDTAGIVRALNAPYYRAHATPGPMDPLGSSQTWQQMQDYLDNPNTNTSLGVGNTAPSGALTPVAQPTLAELQAMRAWSGATGEHFDAPGVNPNAAAAPYTPSQELQTNAYIGEGNTPALVGIDAATSANVPLPRRDPRGYDSLFSSDGQVTTPDGSVVAPGRDAPPNVYVGKDGRTYRRDFTDDPNLPGGTIYHTDGTGARTLGDAKPSKWDSVVDNTGKLLSHTGLGSIVSTLFPDQWNGMGDAFKGLDNGGGGQPIDNVAFTDIINGGHGSDPFFTSSGNNGSGVPAQAAVAAAFPDVNHNGIDDRLEGLDATGYGGNQYRSNRYATFPDMPPYRPGVDNEWNYFHDHLARGGVVGYADGGQVALAGPDPRVMAIADAEDALHAGRADDPAVAKFVSLFGPSALTQLQGHVGAGYSMRPRAQGARQITGPGGPTDDAVPAVIDGKHPAALSSGEVVIPVAAVEGAGNGDPRVGAEKLMALSKRLAAAA